MNHAVFSTGSPIHLVQPFVFPMPPMLASDGAPTELSPALGTQGKGATHGEEAGDWSLDQFPLPFPTPDLASDDQPNGEYSAFATGTIQSSGYSKRQHVTDPNDDTCSPPQTSSPKASNPAQMRTRHQIAAAWWRGINAKRIAKTTGPSESRPSKTPSPVPLSPVASPIMQPINPPSTLVNTLSLAQALIQDPSLQPQVQALLQAQALTPAEQAEFKQQFSFQPQFQYPYQQQLTPDIQPFYYPVQYMCSPMMQPSCSSIDIFGGKNNAAANWGTAKMGMLTPETTNSPTAVDTTLCNNYTSPPTTCSTPQIPQIPQMAYPFTTAPYALSVPQFEYPSPSTHNTYYITNVNNSTFCSNNTFSCPTPPVTPTPIQTPTPFTPTPATSPPPMPSPFSPPPPSTPSESAPNMSHTTNYNFTYNTTYNLFENNVNMSFNNGKELDEYEFGADFHANESAGDFMGSSLNECDNGEVNDVPESAQASTQPVEASENDTEEMEEEEEEEERIDSDSDYEDEGEQQISVRSTMTTRKRTAEVDTVIETEIRSHSRKSKRDPESPSSSPSKESNGDAKDKSKGWKWHEYNAQEPKKRRTTSNYSFTSTPCHKL